MSFLYSKGSLMKSWGTPTLPQILYYPEKISDKHSSLLSRMRQGRTVKSFIRLRPGPVERPLEVALGAPEFGLEEPVDGEEDDAVEALHLKTKKQTV
jgi:hypothetical protein